MIGLAAEQPNSAELAHIRSAFYVVTVLVVSMANTAFLVSAHHPRAHECLRREDYSFNLCKMIYKRLKLETVV
jgi:hypothetical protein